MPPCSSYNTGFPHFSRLPPPPYLSLTHNSILYYQTGPNLYHNQHMQDPLNLSQPQPLVPFHTKLTLLSATSFPYRFSPTTNFSFHCFFTTGFFRVLLYKLLPATVFSFRFFSATGPSNTLPEPPTFSKGYSPPPGYMTGFSPLRQAGSDTRYIMHCSLCCLCSPYLPFPFQLGVMGVELTKS
ncbi:hypothetical protein Pcinc_017508 [Petrolisthes cinctipes]|uniref:Uncharacterized protein n=1 Tax=Petrolisthes cinctipes TaxID=88211 RepID=A0AAE1FQJ5_PETCI|nr:hypothetical protein Pcinc_017508 [Petrolisthes cinctipes]